MDTRDYTLQLKTSLPDEERQESALAHFVKSTRRRERKEWI